MPNPAPPKSDNSSGASFSHLAARMGDEGEFQLFEDTRPLRASGFLSLIFGLLSPLTYFGIALIFIPVIALVAGIRATTKYEGDKPSGYTAGQIGMVIAILFGLFGATVWSSRRSTLAKQAEFYARAYLDTMWQNQPEAAMELGKNWAARTEAPLRPFYQSTEESQSAIDGMKFGDLFPTVRGLQGGTSWKVSRPTKITRGYHGVEKAEVCLKDAENRVDLEAQIFLDINRDRQGNLQWHVMHAQPYRELIVSEGNL